MHVETKLVLNYSLQRSSTLQDFAEAFQEQLSLDLQRMMDYASQKGASSWISSLCEHNFHTHKSSFRDALCLRRNWKPSRLPSTCTCVCDEPFTVEHSLSFLHGGYPILRHNELRTITASLLNKICSNVNVETAPSTPIRRTSHFQNIQ